MNVSRSRAKELLLHQIAHEERLIRIHQAELDRNMSLSIAVATQQQEQQQSHSLENDNNYATEEEEEDLMKTLDSLQSFGTTTTTTPIAMLESKFQQNDPRIHRLLPFVSGVSFTFVRSLHHPFLQQENVALTTTTTTKRRCRLYEFQGNLVDNPTISFSILCHVECDCSCPCCYCCHDVEYDNLATTTTSRRARVVALTTTLDDTTTTTTSCSQEVTNISKVASQLCSIPFWIRQLVSWDNLESRRTQFLQQCQEVYGCTAITRVSAETFCIQLSSTMSDDNNNNNNNNMQLVSSSSSSCGCSLQLVWRWTCTLQEQHGREEVYVKTCLVSPHVKTKLRILSNQSEQQLDSNNWLLQEIICNPQGLSDLVASVGGSCEQAIRLLLQALFGW